MRGGWLVGWLVVGSWLVSWLVVGRSPHGGFALPARGRASPPTEVRPSPNGGFHFPQRNPGYFGRDAGATVSTDAEVLVTDSRFGLVVEGDLADGAEYVFAFDMLDAAGNPVTVTKAARFSAS